MAEASRTPLWLAILQPQLFKLRSHPSPAPDSTMAPYISLSQSPSPPQGPRGPAQPLLLTSLPLAASLPSSPTGVPLVPPVLQDLGTWEFTCLEHPSSSLSQLVTSFRADFLDLSPSSPISHGSQHHLKLSGVFIYLFIYSSGLWYVSALGPQLQEGRNSVCPSAQLSCKC